MKLRARACGTLLLSALLGAAAFGEEAELQQLFRDYEDWQLREFPEYAMARGDYRFADRLTEHSLAAIEARHAKLAAFLTRLEQAGRTGLSPDDQLSFDLFEWMLRKYVDGQRFRTYLMPIGARDGIHQDIPQMAERVRFATTDDYRNYDARLALAPSRVQQTIELLRAGLEAGITPPAVALRGVPKQLDALVDGDGLDDLAKPFQTGQKDEPFAQAKENEGFAQAKEVRNLRDEFAQKRLPKVRAALRELQTFFNAEYLPKCRTSIAAVELPNGAEYYAHQLRVHTTTDMTPQEIHELGLREVQRIRAEMMAVIARTDFAEQAGANGEGDDERFARFLHFLRSDPRFYHTSGEALLADYRDICKQIDAWMPRFFHKLPRLAYGVRKVPDFMAPHQTTAYYSQGDIRNGEPGYFYANCFALDQRPKYEMRALAIHEAVPGHHHQVALAQEMEGGLPEFRKDLWVTAFGEGWALYSERLGIEASFYEDPYDDFGRLTYEMWRACRLVVDPGMHALGWSREQAVDFMRKHTALSHVNIDAEVDRYIAWPGQATAYKIGELKIRALRAEAEQALGSAFDLRAFHDVVLSAGSIPLDVLARRVRAWVKSERRRS